MLLHGSLDPLLSSDGGSLSRCGSVDRNLRSIRTDFRWGDRNCRRCSDSVDRIRRWIGCFRMVDRCGLPMNRQRWDHRRYRWAGHCLKLRIGIACPIVSWIRIEPLDDVESRLADRIAVGIARRQ